MRLSIFRKNDRVLLVGEGNFSFAASLLEHNLEIVITATCHESRAANETARKNLAVLENNGVRVLLGVDATKLGEHSILGAELFDKIVFNFPHVGGKMRLDKNRELLREFFLAARPRLKPNGRILTTLCNGQGGTCVDDPGRRWDDSWKVAEMAAHGNFVLTSVEPFVVSNFRFYTSTGYRGLDKEFNLEKSLTHFFEISQPPSLGDLAPISKVDAGFLEDFGESKSYRDVFGDNSCGAESFGPPVFVFDVTFSVTPGFRVSELYRILYNFAGRIVRNVEFVRSYEFPGVDKVTETYRISYQSGELPLHRDRIVDIHRNVIAKILEDNLKVTVTR